VKELKAVFDSAAALAPTPFKWFKWIPFTPDLLARIYTLIDPNDPLDAAFFACITTTFYPVVRLGKFTVPSISQYCTKPSKFILRGNISKIFD
jgi:hypothetical protein